MSSDMNVSGAGFAVAVNSNQRPGFEDAFAALENFLLARIDGAQGAEEFGVEKNLRRLTGDIHAANPAFDISSEMQDLIGQAYVAELTKYAAAWARGFTKQYQSCLSLPADPEFLETVSMTLKTRLQSDIKTAGFLSHYIDSVHEVAQELNLPGMDDGYREELTGWLCSRLESDLARGDVYNVDDMIYDIQRTMGMNDLQLDGQHRVALTALVTSNGLSILNRSFTDSAQKETPDNKKILESTLNGLRIIRTGQDGHDLDEVRRVLNEAFDRAIVREADMKAKQGTGVTGHQPVPEPVMQ